MYCDWRHSITDDNNYPVGPDDTGAICKTDIQAIAPFIFGMGAGTGAGHLTPQADTRQEVDHTAMVRISARVQVEQYQKSAQSPPPHSTGKPFAVKYHDNDNNEACCAADNNFMTSAASELEPAAPSSVITEIT